MGGWRTAGFLVAVGLWFGAGASAVSPPQHSGMLQPSPPVPQALAPTPAPAPADTALARLIWPLEGTNPRHLYAAPDSMLLGGRLTVAVDVPANQAARADSLLGSTSPWLVAEAEHGRPLPLLALKPDAKQPQDYGWPQVQPGMVRLQKSFRVLRLNPFQVRVGDLVSPVISVGPRNAGGDKNAMAPVRDPRALGWRPANWVVWTAAFIVLALVLWLLWRGWKRSTVELPERKVPVPAWLETSCALEDLLKSGCLERGEGRYFLDRLAAIIRAYLAGRYLVGAKEMTSDEIMVACEQRAYHLVPIKVLGELMGFADRWRYHPTDPDLADCRHAASTFFHQMSAVRINPEFTVVPVDLSLRGNRAWTFLRQELEPTPNISAGHEPGGGM